MRRIAIACICYLATGCLALSTVFAVDRGMISGSTAAPAGLQVQWFTQIATGVRGKVVDVVLDVNENESTTYFDITFGRGREVISQNDLDAFGNPRGIEGAQEQAELRKEIIQKELSARGFENTEVTIQKYSLPESSLYVYTSDGLITALNADTGFVKWTTEVGSRHYPSIGIGANNSYVAAVNGTTVYCLDAETGKVKFTASSKGSVSASPAVSDDFIYVPQFDGRLEVFPIATKGVGSERYIGEGQVMARPTVTAESVAWTTETGFLNVALNKRKDSAPTVSKKLTEAEDKTLSEGEQENNKLLREIALRVRARDLMSSITYRLRTGDHLISPAAASQGMLYTTSLGGFVYAVDEKKGSLEWQYSTGEEIDSQPIYLDGQLYVVTAQNSLFKLDAKTGSLAWENPIGGVSKIVGASKDKLFVIGSRSNLLVLRRDNGQLLNDVGVTDIDLVYQNSISDRLFIGSTNGTIQCLAEVNSNIPYFHAADFEKAMEDKPGDETGTPGADTDIDDPFKTMDSGDAKSGEATQSNENPFGNDADNPFGGGAKTTDDAKSPASDENKPAADDNPFGGGGKTSDDNPFGGGGN